MLGSGASAMAHIFGEGASSPVSASNTPIGHDETMDECHLQNSVLGDRIK